MDSLLGWAAAVLITYLPGCNWLEDGTSKDDSDVFVCPTHPQNFEQDDHPPFPGEFIGASSSSLLNLPVQPLVSPSRPPLKRSARDQHGAFLTCSYLFRLVNALNLGSHKRPKLSVEAYKSGSPVSTRAKKRRHGSAKLSSKDLEARAKVHLPSQSLSSTPDLHGETPSPPASAEDSGIGVHAIRRAPISPNTSPSIIYSAGKKPWPLIADNGECHLSSLSQHPIY